MLGLRPGGGVNDIYSCLECGRGSPPCVWVQPLRADMLGAPFYSQVCRACQERRRVEAELKREHALVGAD